MRANKTDCTLWIEMNMEWAGRRFVDDELDVQSEGLHGGRVAVAKLGDTEGDNGMRYWRDHPVGFLLRELDVDTDGPCVEGEDRSDNLDVAQDYGFHRHGGWKVRLENETKAQDLGACKENG
jgi:hypothetical protein